MKSNNKQGLKFFVSLKFEFKRISAENFISYAATLITPLQLLLSPLIPSCVYLGVECNFLWPQLRGSFLKMFNFFLLKCKTHISPGKMMSIY